MFSAAQHRFLSPWCTCSAFFHSLTVVQVAVLSSTHSLEAHTLQLLVHARPSLPRTRGRLLLHRVCQYASGRRSTYTRSVVRIRTWQRGLQAPAKAVNAFSYFAVKSNSQS